MSWYMERASSAARTRLLKVLLITTGVTLIAATGYAQNRPGVDCTPVQKAAEGGGGPNLQKAAEGGGGPNLQKAAEGGGGPNLQKAAEGGGGPNLQKAAEGGGGPDLQKAAEGGGGPNLSAKVLPPCPQ